MGGFWSDLKPPSPDEYELQSLGRGAEAREEPALGLAEHSTTLGQQPTTTGTSASGAAAFEVEMQRVGSETTSLIDHPGASQSQGDVGLSAAEDIAPRGILAAAASAETVRAPMIGRGSSAATEAASQALRLKEQTKVDSRNNDIAATIRETRWSMALWKSLSPEQIEPILEHVTSLLDTAKEFESRLAHVSDKFSPREQQFIKQEFNNANLIAERLDDWAEDFDEIRLCEILLDNKVGIKGIADLLTHLLEASSPTFIRPVRAHSLFVDRGRQPIPQEKQRSESQSNRHGGITEGSNRTRSM